MSANSIVISGLINEQCKQVASLVAEQLEMYYLDVLGLFLFDISPYSISDMLQKMGLNYYKECEKSTCKFVSDFENTVIVPGGYKPSTKQSFETLVKNNIVVFLSNSSSSVKKTQDKREYADKIEKKFYYLSDKDIEIRSKYYASKADIKINATGKSAFKIAFEILRKLEEKYIGANND